MTGIFDTPVADSITLRREGQFATSYGERLGAELQTGLAGVRQDIALGHPEEAGTDPNTGLPIPGWEDQPRLTGAEATAKYGIPGVLAWRPGEQVPESVASDIADRRREELYRQSVLERSPDYGIGGGLLGFGTRMLPGFLDPLNIAASFVPGVSEARAALMSTTTLGRMAVGAARGVAGTAALAPVQALIGTHDQEDISGVNILANIITGGFLGAGLHLLAGGKSDALAHAAPAEAEALAKAPPGTAEAVVRGSVAAMLEDRAPDLEGLTYNLGGERVPGDTGLLAYARARGEPAAEPAPPELYQLVPPEPERLGDWVRAQPEGESLDQMRLRAWDQGFLPGEEEPSLSEFEAAVARDERGEPVYREEDAMRAQAHETAIAHNAEIDRLAAELGIDITGRQGMARFLIATRGRLTGEPPLAPGMVRLYRGETGRPGKPALLPEWLQRDPRVLGMLEATGRWFSRSLETARYYAREHGLGGPERISYVDVPEAEAERYLSANQPEARRFSAAGRQQEEYFVSKELAAARRPYRTREDFWNEVAARLPMQALEDEIDRQRAAAQDAWLAATNATNRARAMGEAQAAVAGEKAVPSVEQLEEQHAKYDQQTQVAAPARAGAPGGQEPVALRERPGAVEAGARPRGRGAGARPGEAPEGEPRGIGAEPERDLTQASEAEISAEADVIRKEIEGAEHLDEADAKELAEINEEQAAASTEAEIVRQAGACRSDAP